MASGLTPGLLIDGKYRIVRRIGRGGMGAVYEGENVRIRRRVAIKVLHSTLATDRRFVERFEREAQAVARIGSQHVTDVLDLGELGGIGEAGLYIVMEYLDGETLADRLKASGSLTPEATIAILVQLLDGLAKMHAASVVHRDLKPANIFLTGSNDFVKIIDFGIAKFTSESDPQWTTVGSRVLGTPGYLAPEQLAEGGEVGADADLFATGVLLYRCVAGRLPYDAKSNGELLIQIRDNIRVPIEQAAPGIDPLLAKIVTKGIAPKPADRFRSAGELRDALVAWTQRDDEPEHERTVVLVAPKPAAEAFAPPPPEAFAPPPPEAFASPPPARRSSPVELPRVLVATGKAHAATPPRAPSGVTVGVRAALVGAAVGVVGAVALYEMLRR